MNGLKLNPLTNGQIFSTDGVKLKVIHTPGHTTDHCILFIPETKELFSGDCVLGEGSTVFEDLYSYMKSLNLILNQDPLVIYPGHGKILEVRSICAYLSRINKFKRIFFRIQRKPFNTILIIEMREKAKFLMYWLSIRMFGILIWT